MNWMLEEALGWFDRVYGRTLEVAQAVPEEFMGWQPEPDELSCGDLIRHIASTELMNARRLADGRLVYPGHQEKLGEHREEALAYLAASHAEAVTCSRVTARTA